LFDVDARVQLFDLKTVYKFNSTPGIDKYNMPLYTTQVQLGGQNVLPFPVYQGFFDPCFIDGIQAPFYTQRESFYNLYPYYTQDLQQAAIGDGTIGPYFIRLSSSPVLTGHVDMTGIIAYINQGNTYEDPILLPSGSNVALDNLLKRIPTTSINSQVTFVATGANGQNITVADTGIFLKNNTDGDTYGFLMAPGNAPYGNNALGTRKITDYTTTSNMVNYNKGYAHVTFPEPIPAGTPIQAKSYTYQQGLSRTVFFYNNVITLRPCPFTQYTVELGAYLTPAAFLNSPDAIPFGYMAEYLARGAARKILSDTGDQEQFAFYEPLFREQEMLVWKRSQRQFTANRTETIFSGTSGFGAGMNNYGNFGL